MGQKGNRRKPEAREDNKAEGKCVVCRDRENPAGKILEAGAENPGNIYSV
jgi:hypothetical protein